MTKAFLWLLLAITVVAATYVLAISRHSELNRAGLLGASGRIDAGKKFGVSIGADYREVQDALEGLGFEERDLTKPQSCHGFDYPEHQEPQLWFDDSWRKGTLCVVTSGGSVVDLSWSYGMGFP